MNQNTNSHSISHNVEIRTYAQKGRSLRETDSNSEFERLSGEMNQKITHEMGDFMSIVSSLIQRAKNEALSDHIMLQIQATLSPDRDRCLKEDGRFKLDDRGTDLKTP